MAIADREMFETMLQTSNRSEAKSEALIKLYLSFIKAGIAAIRQAHKSGEL